MPPGYVNATRAWESAAAGLPTIRGRRNDGGGPIIHFLSGNGFCGGVYWSFLKHFSASHGLILHDIEGHGASDAVAKFSGTRALAKRIVQVIDEQTLQRPMIGMGHSRGAAMTVKVAADNPGLFSALVLLDPIIIPAPAWVVWRAAAMLGLNSMARATRKRRSAWPSRDEAFSHLKDRGIFKGWDDEALGDFVDHAMHEQDGRWALRCSPDLEAQIYEHPVYPWHALKKIKVPVLFLHGDRSYGFFPWSGRTAKRVNPNVEVATFPGHHCFMLEKPAEAAEFVREWLATQPPP